jgi:hypothetical protein
MNKSLRIIKIINKRKQNTTKKSKNKDKSTFVIEIIMKGIILKKINKNIIIFLYLRGD